MIPENTKAGNEFLGVETSEATIFIASIVLGFIVGRLGYAFTGFIFIPLGGYLANKFYIAEKKKMLSGFMAEFLYAHGFGGYSSAFNAKNKIFIGDMSVINPNSKEEFLLIPEDKEQESSL